MLTFAEVGYNGLSTTATVNHGGAENHPDCVIMGRKQMFTPVTSQMGCRLEYSFRLLRDGPGGQSSKISMCVWAVHSTSHGDNLGCHIYKDVLPDSVSRRMKS